ncbi:MAG: discoidin domain-containing protein [Planctomycetes bacterium]|nr:discoidin domain-containing protein [Planctomycetota bacterium]
MKNWFLLFGIFLLPTACVHPAFGQPKAVYVQVRVDSEASGYEGVNALDGNPNTMWHSQFRQSNPKHPHEIVIDLGRSYEISGFEYLPRPGGGNGTIKDYEFYVNDNDKDFGQPVARGTFGRSQSTNGVKIGSRKKGRYVKLVALSEMQGKPWTSIAGLEVLSDGVAFRTEGSRSAVAQGVPSGQVVLKRQGPDDDTVAGALELARRTLAYVEDSAPRPRLATELKVLEEKVEQADGADRESLHAQIKALRRSIILSHPAIDFERLLINKRPPPAFSHQSDQYLGRYSGLGDGLVILDDWKTDPKPTVLLAGQLPPGSVLHPDLSFDARKILFSYCDHSELDPERRRFFIYEMNVDGSGLRQITGTANDPLAGFDDRETVLIEDWDPCYLPDGGIAFISTRNQGGVRCHHGGRYCPTYTLYRCEYDGSDIRPMVYGEANEWDPSVMDDGRIIWTRWDYINRHDTVYQSLWTIHPDGTGTAHFYGNYTRNPCSIAEARAIPGSRKVVATATAHHSYTSGSIIAIDPLAGQDGAAPIERITSEIPFPETEGWGQYAAATPWPLNEDLFLMAYSHERHARQGGRNSANAYAIYLVDTLGGRELIYRDPEQSCFAPIPIVSRPMPPALTSTIAANTKTESGVFHVKDVYQSTEEIPRNSIKGLRVLRMYPQPTIRVPDRSATLFETPKQVLGTVPVDDDGSVAFRAPAGQPLMFQLLDEDGMAVMSMRTFVYLHPGETATCVGCHEPRNSSPARNRLSPGLRIHEITPPVGPQYDGGLSFARTAQPVLDRHCIGCHGLDKTEGDINLLGTIDSNPLKLGNVRASAAYHSLTKKPGLVSIAHRNQETAFSVPKDYYSHAGRLAKLLREGDANHAPLGGRDGIDREGFQRIVDWLDVNAQFYGDYSWNKQEWVGSKPEGETALREHIAKTFGPKLAEQPYAALVNVSMPTESRILKSPLAVAVGGWEQVDGGWSNTEDPGYQKMLGLVRASIGVPQYHNACGTCNRVPCECRGCWVRHARTDYRKKLADNSNSSAP